MAGLGAGGGAASGDARRTFAADGAGAHDGALTVRRARAASDAHLGGAA